MMSNDPKFPNKQVFGDWQLRVPVTRREATKPEDGTSVGLHCRFIDNPFSSVQVDGCRDARTIVNAMNHRVIWWPNKTQATWDPALCSQTLEPSQICAVAILYSTPALTYAQRATSCLWCLCRTGHVHSIFRTETLVVQCRLFPNFVGESLLHFTEERARITTSAGPIDIRVFSWGTISTGRLG